MREIVSPLSGIRSSLGPITSILPSYAVLGFKPQLVLDFDDEKYFTRSTKSTFASAITHTRASTATYVDSTGTLQTAAINEPRVGHHVWNGSAWVNEGLLHESEARTNLLPYSEDFANAAWVKTNMLLGAGVTSPDGTTNSTKLIPNTVSAEHYIQDNLTAATGTFTDSVFAKAAEFKNLVIRPVHIGADQGATQQAVFDLGLGVVGTISANTTAAIQDFGNGWYRCSFTYTVSGTITGAFTVRLQINDNSNAAVFAGDDASGLYVFGAQREIAPTPSSYIPTNSGSTVTRAADVLTIPAANLPWPSPEYIGPELVTNGTFDTDISGWIGANSARTLSWSSGSLRITANVDNAFSQAYQTIPVTIGSVYLVSADIGSGTEVGRILLSNTSPTAASIGTTTFGNNISVERIFVATTTTLHVSGQLVGANTGEFCEFDNISVREINPLAVSIQMDGRVTYADTDAFAEVRFLMWSESVNNQIRNDLDTNGSDTGQFRSAQTALGVFDTVTGPIDSYLPDVLVPFNVASRNGSTFVNIAIDGTAMTADTTPVSLPDLSAINLSLGNIYNGTIRTFRMWANDIGDAGLVEATEPSLVPSLSLTFDGTENSFIVEDWSE